MRELGAAGIEVLYDDRDARPGVKFADAELLGIPHRIVVGERGLEAGTLEYRHRRATDSEDFPQHAAVEFIRSRLQFAAAGLRLQPCRRLRVLRAARAWRCSALQSPGRRRASGAGAAATRNCARWCSRRSARRSASPTSTTPRSGTR